MNNNSGNERLSDAEASRIAAENFKEHADLPEPLSDYRYPSPRHLPPHYKPQYYDPHSPNAEKALALSVIALCFSVVSFFLALLLIPVLMINSFIYACTYSSPFDNGDFSSISLFLFTFLSSIAGLITGTISNSLYRARGSASRVMSIIAISVSCVSFVIFILLNGSCYVCSGGRYFP